MMEDVIALRAADPQGILPPAPTHGRAGRAPWAGSNPRTSKAGRSAGTVPGATFGPKRCVTADQCPSVSTGTRTSAGSRTSVSITSHARAAPSRAARRLETDGPGGPELPFWTPDAHMNVAAMPGCHHSGWCPHPTTGPLGMPSS
ncbi:MAG: hypothetical protein ACKORL_08400 [Phycisphaerales bacterium]